MSWETDFNFGCDYSLTTQFFKARSEAAGAPQINTEEVGHGKGCWEQCGIAHEPVRLP